MAVELAFCCRTIRTVDSRPNITQGGGAWWLLLASLPRAVVRPCSGNGGLALEAHGQGLGGGTRVTNGSVHRTLTMTRGDEDLLALRCHVYV